MFPVGGIEVMLLGTALSAAVCVVLALVLQRRLGLTGWTLAALLWSLVVIAIITLIPASGAPGIVPAEGRLDTCSFDIGGPAPDGFWIFSGGQRLLNTVVFMAPGALLVLTATRWRSGWLTVPLGLALLVAYSAGIEWTQLELARIDRACDVTDIIDNVTGAVLGVLVGLVLAVAFRPWRLRR